MLKAMFGNTEVTIREMEASLNRQIAENALLEYVGRRAIKDIVSAIMELAENDNQIIAEVENKLYKLVLSNGVPSFETYNFKEKLAEILVAKGFEMADANECVEAMLTTVEPIQSKKPLWTPEGFEYYTGDLDTGYVVKDKKGNEFTYMPATDEYISRYEISKGDDGITPMSVPGKPAWTNITHSEAQKVAQSFAPNCNSDLIKDYNDWKKICDFIASKIGKSLVYDNSTAIGAYYNNGGEVNTGENPTFMIYNIDCLAGNHWCYTNEVNEYLNIVICVGSYGNDGGYEPMVSRFDVHPNIRNDLVGFRIVLKKK